MDVFVRWQFHGRFNIFTAPQLGVIPLLLWVSSNRLLNTPTAPLLRVFSH